MHDKVPIIWAKIMAPFVHTRCTTPSTPFRCVRFWLGLGKPFWNFPPTHLLSPTYPTHPCLPTYAYIKIQNRLSPIYLPLPPIYLLTYPPIYLHACPSTFLHTSPLDRYPPNLTYLVAPNYMAATSIDLTTIEIDGK